MVPFIGGLASTRIRSAGRSSGAEVSTLRTVAPTGIGVGVPARYTARNASQPAARLSARFGYAGSPAASGNQIARPCACRADTPLTGAGLSQTAFARTADAIADSRPGDTAAKLRVPRRRGALLPEWW